MTFADKSISYQGGHFATLEEPESFLQDVEEFLDKVCDVRGG